MVCEEKQEHGVDFTSHMHGETQRWGGETRVHKDLGSREMRYSKVKMLRRDITATQLQSNQEVRCTE